MRHVAWFLDQKKCPEATFKVDLEIWFGRYRDKCQYLHFHRINVRQTLHTSLEICDALILKFSLAFIRNK